MKNEGRIIRKVKEKNFTVVDNGFINNKTLSLEGKGLLLVILSLTDNWELYRKDLAKRTGQKAGKIDRVFKELQQHGYIVSKKIQGEKGYYTGWEHIVHETPISRPTLSPTSAEVAL
jgi:hypothetical protein